MFSATDPTGDDNGPGTYAYPTDAAFHPGAYDIQQFQVYDSGPDSVTFRVQTADLSPTFGSPLGAQLVDVYVNNDPAGQRPPLRRSPGATTPSMPGRHGTG